MAEIYGCFFLKAKPIILTRWSEEFGVRCEETKKKRLGLGLGL